MNHEVRNNRIGGQFANGDVHLLQFTKCDKASCVPKMAKVAV
jgi:hypothetical protein